jgi:hypothetical protein
MSVAYAGYLAAKRDGQGEVSVDGFILIRRDRTKWVQDPKALQ